VKYIVSVAGQEIEVEVDGDLVTVGGTTRSGSLRTVSGTALRQLIFDGRPILLAARSGGRGQWSVGVGGDRWEVEVLDERTRHVRSLTAGRARPDGPATLRAPMPGLVVRVLVDTGQQVAAGTGLVVLEAMKMENELKAPAAGTVSLIRAEAGAAVEKGQVLVEIHAT
jgi:pyruvate carboxylase subunit B